MPRAGEEAGNPSRGGHALPITHFGKLPKGEQAPQRRTSSPKANKLTKGEQAHGKQYSITQSSSLTTIL